MIKITTGLSTIGGKSESCQRELARLTPSLYHLLPSFRGAVVNEKGRTISAYRPGTWQSSVVRTIAQYVHLHGKDTSLNKAQRQRKAENLFGALLRSAQRHRQRTDRLDLASAGLQSRDWLCIAGIGKKTRVRLQVNPERHDVRFDLSSVHRRNDWKPDGSVQTPDTGDGTVPFLGAVPTFLPTNEMVCLSDGEFGYWEIADRALEGPMGVGLHGMLPKMNMAQKLTVCHLLGAVHDGVLGRRAPTLHPVDDQWDPPIKGLRERGK